MNALTGYFPSLADPSPVLELLSDESLRVRRAALSYLRAHPVDVAAAVLAKRVQDEHDPDLLAEMLELLELDAASFKLRIDLAER